MRTFEVVFVIGVQLTRYSFWQWELFRGLVNILRMCYLCVGFGGGRAVWVL